MSILVIGLSHRSTPVPVLERAALPADGVAKLLQDLVTSERIGEAVVLSTCNRVEVYVEVAKFHSGVASVTELLVRHAGLALEELAPHLYVHYEERAVQHLFAVACGLDSMVVGEGQILGQVKAALRLAQETGAAGRVLNELVQQALRVGKRAHTETDIDTAGASLVTVGLELGELALGGLRTRQALVVGAGSMSALAASTLARAGVRDIVVANRTLAHGERLATQVGGRAIPMRDLGEALVTADVVISCTGALGVVVPRQLAAAARDRRGPAPQFFLDLALPRDVEPSVNDLDGVAVVDLERIAHILQGDERAGDIETVRQIVAEEVSAFLGWQRAVTVAPTVVALRAMAAEVVQSELTRLSGKMPGLDDRERQEIAQTVRRVVDKLLHAPTVRVKELAEEPGGDSYAAALRELFDLDPATADAVTRIEPVIELGTEPVIELGEALP